MEVKDIIKNRRTELDLTMKQVAELVGVSEATISRWESGDIENMKRDKISALAKALRISPATLMGWDDSTEDVPQNGQNDGYYVNSDTADVANEILHNEDMRLLFDAAKGSDPEALQMAAAMLKKMKGNND